MIQVIGSGTCSASKNMLGFVPESEDYKIINTRDYLNYSKCSGFNFFLSKHESSKGVKSLTCHTPGNFGTNKYGGVPEELSISNALIQTECLRLLKELKQERNWPLQVTFEVTHHGPCLNCPCLFVEIGSSPTEWSNEEYGSGTASVVLELINDFESINEKDKNICIGIGGSHYAKRFTQLILDDSNLAMGHMCPDWALDDLNERMFKQMVNKTVPEPSSVLLHKNVSKGLRRKLKQWGEGLNLDYRLV